MTSTIPQISQNSRVLAARLAQIKPDETIPYAELSRLIGGDVQKQQRWILESAKRIVERDHGILILSVRKEGVRRCAPGEISGIGDGAIAAIGRKARRASKAMLRGSQHTDGIDPATLKQINSRVSMLGAIGLCAKPKNIEKFENAPSVNGNISIADSLKLFQLEKGGDATGQ